MRSGIEIIDYNTPDYRSLYDKYYSSISNECIAIEEYSRTVSDIIKKLDKAKLVKKLIRAFEDIIKNISAANVKKIEEICKENIFLLAGLELSNEDLFELEKSYEFFEEHLYALVKNKNSQKKAKRTHSTPSQGAQQ
jgi:hypothetical protein